LEVLFIVLLVLIAIAIWATNRRIKDQARRKVTAETREAAMAEFKAQWTRGRGWEHPWIRWP